MDTIFLDCSRPADGSGRGENSSHWQNRRHSHRAGRRTRPICRLMLLRVQPRAIIASSTARGLLGPNSPTCMSGKHLRRTFITAR